MWWRLVERDFDDSEDEDGEADEGSEANHNGADVADANIEEESSGAMLDDDDSDENAEQENAEYEEKDAKKLYIEDYFATRRHRLLLCALSLFMVGAIFSVIVVIETRRLSGVTYPSAHRLWSCMLSLHI